MSNAQFENVSYLCRQCAGKMQTSQTMKISTNSDIVKVLSLGANSFVTSYESVLGRVTFNGKTTLRFLYSDGVNVVGSSFVAEFSDTLQSEFVSPTSQMLFEVSVIDSKVESSVNTASVTLLLEVTAYTYVENSATYLSGGDMFLQSTNAEVLTNAKYYTLPLSVESELTAKRKIDSVLLAESNVCHLDYNKQADILSVKGDAIVRLTYISDGKIVTDELSFSFEREVDATLIGNDGEYKFFVNIHNTKVRLNIVEGEENNTFSVEILADICCEWNKIEDLTIVTDAYSCTEDYTFTRDKFYATLPCGTVSTSKTIEGTLPFENQNANLLTVVNSNIYISNFANVGNKLVVEGVITTTSLVMTESGVEGKMVELPFSEKLDCNTCENCQPSVKATIVSIDARQGAELTLTAVVCFEIASYSTNVYNIITSLEEQPFDKSTLPAIEVCMASKGETLWQLAKGLHMSEQDLLEINLEITNPLESDARIVVYNRLQQD